MRTEKPENGPLSKLSSHEFADFIVHLGFLAFRTAGAAALATHKGPLDTVKDYYDPLPAETQALELAGLFWKDLASCRLTTEEFVSKWYGLTGDQACSLFAPDV